MYANEIDGKGYELIPSIENIIGLFNYFYGTDVQRLEQLGGLISGSTRKISIDLTGASILDLGEIEVTFKTIKVNIFDQARFFDESFNIIFSNLHADIEIAGQEKILKSLIEDDSLALLLAKVLNGEQEQEEGELGGQQDLKKYTFFVFFTNGGLLDQCDESVPLPVLNVIYYSLLMKSPENKVLIIKDILFKRERLFGYLRPMMYNLLDNLRRQDSSILYEVCRLLVISGRCWGNKIDKKIVTIVKKSIRKNSGFASALFKQASSSFQSEKDQREMIKFFQEFLS